MKSLGLNQMAAIRFEVENYLEKNPQAVERVVARRRAK